MKRRLLPVAGFAAALMAAMPWSQAAAQGGCAFRGALDEAYCDANRDMVADVPTEANRQRDPSTLVFA
jgi:phosphonate transport system substrate-binding protein